jgi:hypothetical protein
MIGIELGEILKLKNILSFQYDPKYFGFFDQYNFLIVNTHKILYENYRTYAQEKGAIMIFIDTDEEYKLKIFFLKLLEEKF